MYWLVPFWDWLPYLVLIGPLWALTTALIVLARLLGRKEGRLPAMAAICIIAVPVAAVVYLFVTGWRPSWQHVILYVIFTVGSEVIADRLDQKLGPPPAADLVQWGRVVNRGLRHELTKLGLVIAVIAIVLFTIQPAFSLVLVAATSLWTLIWLGMRRMESGVDVIVNCTPEDAFDFVSDAGNQPYYLPEVESVERLTLGSPRIGTRVRMRHRDDSHGIEEIFEYDRPRRLAVGLPDVLQANRSIWTFEPAANGTRVRYAYRYQMNMVEALAGTRFTQGLSKPQRTAWRRAFLARLKVVLEAQAPGYNQLERGA